MTSSPRVRLDSVRFQAPKLALRPGGGVVLTAPPNTHPAVAVLGAGGGPVFPTIPTSTLVDVNGQTIHVPATMGQPIVTNDGSAYVMYAVRQLPYPANSVTSQLYLLKIALDGTETTIQLGASTDANLFPGSLMPNGQGGVLATWADVPPLPPNPPIVRDKSYHAAVVSELMDMATPYVMPNAPQRGDLVGDPTVVPKLVLGEGSTAFVAWANNVTNSIS